MIRERRVSPVDAVDALDTLLGTAMRVIDQLRAEGLLERLVALLACMLPEDRESIVRILEHDADAHTQLGEGNRWSRFALRPNPFAQLFSRANVRGRLPGVRYLEARRATSVGVRMARLLAPWGEGGWDPETIDTWRRLAPETRTYLIGMSRRILRVLEENRPDTSRV
jgi:hypothetical protein